MVTANTAPFEANLTPSTGLQSYLESRGPYVIHATGRLTGLIRAAQQVGRQAALARAHAAAEQAAANPAVARAQEAQRAQEQIRLGKARREEPTPRTNVQSAIKSSMTAGLLPQVLGATLLVMTDVSANPAVRAEAAKDAANGLARLQDDSFSAVPYLAQLRGMEAHFQQTKDGVKEATGQVRGLLGAIFRDPAKAQRNLTALAAECSGYGHLAQEIEQHPELLGELRGGFLFGRRERAQALSSVPDLAAAVEARGRMVLLHDEDKLGLADLRSRPQRVPELARALEAHKVLSAVQGVLRGRDPVTSDILMRAAHEAGVQCSVERIMAAKDDLSAEFHGHLLEQACRRDSAMALQQSRSPGAAVDHFERGATIMGANVDARDRLIKEGNMFAAKSATDWATMAQKEVAWAAGTIMASPALCQEAASRQLLPQVMQAHQDMNAQQQVQVAAAIELPSREAIPVMSR